MTTEDIINALSDEKIQEFPQEYFLQDDIDVEGYLRSLLDERGLKIRDLIPKLNYERTYTCQLFSGHRDPTRIFVFRLAVVLGLGFEQTQRTLFITGNKLLYAKVRYDAAIIFCLQHSYDVQKTEDLLKEIGEESLFFP